ncbi:nucleotide exchange factor GrpE [Candidatus Microgenomates bacterium]|nr:nucleotide exchange factor GrpE [Candidatus Microgenomates bacterium]
MPKPKKPTEIEQIVAEKEEYLNGWKRAMADLDNYKKQVGKEKEMVVQFLKVNSVSGMLPIVANFEKAIGAIPTEQKESEWTKGIVAIKIQLDELLKKEGLEKMITVGQKFDPNLHEALLEEESEGEEGMILEEFEPGYRIGERVVKYPRVKVAKKRN